MQTSLSASQWTSLALCLAIAGFGGWQFRNFIRTGTVWHSFLRFGLNPWWELGFYLLVLIVGLSGAFSVLEHPAGRP